MTNTLLSAWAIAALTTLAGLFAYDHWFAQPRTVVGLVDVVEILRAKEQEYGALLRKSDFSEADRRAADEVAAKFAAALPGALAEIATECQCVVLVKSAVVSAPAAAPDLTARLRQKLGLS